jgi:hypothetical protein
MAVMAGLLELKGNAMDPGSLRSGPYLPQALSLDACRSAASLEHLEVLIEQVDPAPLATGDLAQGDGQLEGGFSNFRPKT